MPSLGVGIILSSLIYENFQFTDTLKRIGKTILHLFYEDGELATGNPYVLGFLIFARGHDRHDSFIRRRNSIWRFRSP